MWIQRIGYENTIENKWVLEKKYKVEFGFTLIISSLCFPLDGAVLMSHWGCMVQGKYLPDKLICHEGLLT